jgi:hypothetical protein
MATQIQHIRNPEAPPRRVDRPRFGEDSGEERWPLARLRKRLTERLAALLRPDEQNES